VTEETLHRDAVVNEPGLIGARWWQDSVSDPIGRRRAITAVLGAGLGLGLVATALFVHEVVTEDEPKTERRSGLALQREYGWSFGAAAENLVFNGQTTEPFDPSRLDSLATDLAPRSPSHRPFAVQTLFEALDPPPPKRSADDPAPIVPLKTALRPIATPSMRDAFARGSAAESMLRAAHAPALVVDLDGEDSVAFAAAVATSFDPVFLFDNWPHPRGVVPAHLALAAAAYYQLVFASARTTAPRDAPPMFVLDRRRLAPYVESASQFDNRWVARMPGAAALNGLGIRRILYVMPSEATYELDDLNDDFVADRTAGIVIVLLDVHAIDAARLSADDVPVPRRTAFSSGARAGARPTPPDFGSVPVAVAAAGGALLGVAWSRSGTWNRGGGG
jgi:hypothetical protein